MWYLFKDKAKSTASIFDDEEGDLFKEKAAVPEATMKQTNENKARAEQPVSAGQEGVQLLARSSGTRKVVSPCVYIEVP